KTGIRNTVGTSGCRSAPGRKSFSPNISLSPSKGGSTTRTGLGSAMIVDGIVEPMELGHLPFRKGTYESHVGNHALKKKGAQRWSRLVADVVALFTAALEPDEVVVGGGNVKRLRKLPPKCRAGDNRNAFLGGFRLWERCA